MIVRELPTEPKPLNSGTPEGEEALDSMAKDVEGGGVIGGGVEAVVTFEGDLDGIGAAILLFCGLIDLARSVANKSVYCNQTQ